ncbi:MAG: ATP phosphoribosyltransferase [Deltaproteobacteria bacterium]|nr:ATP phosphoribosyltransferase [Deltaproteobacteria bacterium]
MTRASKDTLTIALPKGRVMKQALKIFAKIGIEPLENMEESRKLIFDDKKNGLRFLVVKPTDVPTYVEYGAADIGVAGKDVLMEQERDVYEPLDLKIGRCRMMVAEPAALSAKDDPSQWTSIRIATKYPNITEKFFASKGVQVEMIKLYGSIELAPLIGLAERIVDLVETGETLKQNGLVEVEEIMKITSRLIVNRASLKIKGARIAEIIEGLRKEVEGS